MSDTTSLPPIDGEILWEKFSTTEKFGARIVQRQRGGEFGFQIGTPNGTIGIILDFEDLPALRQALDDIERAGA